MAKKKNWYSYNLFLSNKQVNYCGVVRSYSYKEAKNIVADYYSSDHKEGLKDAVLFVDKLDKKENITEIDWYTEG